MENISPALLDWFYKNQRSLPFRTDPSPYHVWLSEIMLQQTRVSAALPYYERFLAALPDIPALAACEEEKLNKLWEGLGYYSRVRNLKKCAQVIESQYGGEFPTDHAQVLSLPGIGPYTAGAICSIAFNQPTPAVDGNVLRVAARVGGCRLDILDQKNRRQFRRWVEAAPEVRYPAAAAGPPPPAPAAGTRFFPPGASPSSGPALRWDMTGYLVQVEGRGPEDWLWADGTIRARLAVPSAFEKFTRALPAEGE